MDKEATDPNENESEPGTITLGGAQSVGAGTASTTSPTGAGESMQNQYPHLLAGGNGNYQGGSGSVNQGGIEMEMQEQQQKPKMKPPVTKRSKSVATAPTRAPSERLLKRRKLMDGTSSSAGDTSTGVGTGDDALDLESQMDALEGPPTLEDLPPAAPEIVVRERIVVDDQVPGTSAECRRLLAKAQRNPLYPIDTNVGNGAGVGAGQATGTVGSFVPLFDGNRAGQGSGTSGSLVPPIQVEGQLNNLQNSNVRVGGSILYGEHSTIATNTNQINVHFNINLPQSDSQPSRISKRARSGSPESSPSKRQMVLRSRTIDDYCYNVHVTIRVSPALEIYEDDDPDYEVQEPEPFEYFSSDDEDGDESEWEDFE